MCCNAKVRICQSSTLWPVQHASAVFTATFDPWKHPFEPSFARYLVVVTEDGSGECYRPNLIYPPNYRVQGGSQLDSLHADSYFRRPRVSKQAITPNPIYECCSPNVIWKRTERNSLYIYHVEAQGRRLLRQWRSQAPSRISFCPCHFQPQGPTRKPHQNQPLSIRANSCHRDHEAPRRVRGTPTPLTGARLGRRPLLGQPRQVRLVYMPQQERMHQDMEGHGHPGQERGLAVSR